MAELPSMKTEFSMARIRSDLSLAIAGTNSFLEVTFGTEDDEYVTFSPCQMITNQRLVLGTRGR